MTVRPFNTDAPLAYFITWTTYGTWLPGDERGWRKRDTPEALSLSEIHREIAGSDMTEPAYRMSPDDREIVQATITKHCTIREWFLHAVNARSNHVHVVVTATDYPPTTVRDQFKAWCTRHLKKSHKDREKFWTEGASCRWINVEEDLADAIFYVLEGQDRK